ncbi:SAM-dependent methyltransferase [Streptomyces sp. 8K308]|uniref:SAM-dependent methyltransferase n=1 Tax=Streptomyces sp. 8K308 TaxID=2530388 RepID=UPI00104CB07B|nr:SAM-dependent methyltransferase [Streptomyces sp. 8K308]TDC25693.1 SAM-dependent methyltransferase [Streptomyces sp. 8K308]
MDGNEPAIAAIPEVGLEDLRLGRPHSARMYDFFLGGKDNYEADRKAAIQALTVYPGIITLARENRSFMHRAVRTLAEAGIRQFLDIGTGIPTSPNLHEVVQSVAPECRVVYVDNDPLVLAHAQALLDSSPEGRTAYLRADGTDPKSILSAPELTSTLDLTRPVALSLCAVLHFMPDDRDPYGVVKTLVDAVPSGSALTISHATPDFDPVATAKAVEIYRASGTPAQVRTRAEVERFFAGLDLVEPGLEVAHRWRPYESSARLHVLARETMTDAEVSLLAGVAFKP